MLCQKIISGGQTGVDRAALDAALENMFPCGGYCPQGRQAEDGIIPQNYPLQELNRGDYAARTIKNVEISDGTLLIFKNKMEGGTKLSYEIAIAMKKPVFLIKIINTNVKINVGEILRWIEENKIIFLNVAGPRLSEWAQSYPITKSIIHELINQSRE